MALRHRRVPVVVAPAGLTLGGGCEIALHGDRVQAAAESYIGLVEVGVGLIPAGGGTKEMLARAVDAAAAAHADLLPFVQRGVRDDRVREGLDQRRRRAAARLSARRRRVTMNRERLMADAKALALERVREGYQPPAPRTAIPVGGESVLAALKLGVHLAWRAGRISDHDALVGRALAHVLAGGSLPHRDDGQRAVPARSRARGVSAAVRRAQDARADPAHAEDRKAAEELTRDDLIDRGTGPPLVLIPGLQGRWEYMRAAVDALAASLPRHHVLARGERTADAPCRGIDGSTSGRDALDAADRARPVICGVSFGGLIALRVRRARSAATAALVLVSTPARLAL